MKIFEDNYNFILINYLSSFPLFSSKYLNFKDFEKVIFMLKTNEHKKPEGLLKICEISKNMNNKRTVFI